MLPCFLLFSWQWLFGLKLVDVHTGQPPGWLKVSLGPVFFTWGLVALWLVVGVVLPRGRLTTLHLLSPLIYNLSNAQSALTDPEGRALMDKAFDWVVVFNEDEDGLNKLD
jgi:hypothetical protein